MKGALTVLLSLTLFFSCTKPEKPSYAEFKKAYNSFVELASKELGAKYGMAITVVKDDDIVFEKYLGMADIDKDIKVSENTLFYIASVTKSFTAMTALILEAKGQLDFDKSLAEFFPEIDFAPELKADYITIEHLVTHTFGLKNDAIENVLAYTGFHDKDKLHKMLAELTEVNTNAPFGEFEYTNLGYNILEMIIERELGEDWKAFVRKEVFQPLEMNNTSTSMSSAVKQGWDIAKPHNQTNLENKLVRHSLEKKDNTMHAAGGVLSTAKDMAQWMIVELNNGKINNEQIIESSLIEKSQLSIAQQEREWFDFKRFGYGYGWNIATTPLGDTLVNHYGNFTGMHPQFSFVKKTGVGVIVLANEGTISRYLNTLLSAYVFDYFSKRENLDAYYKDKLNEYVENYQERKKGFSDYMMQNSKKPWKLELPVSSYIGTYTSDLFGTLVVKEVEDNKLMVTIGNMVSDIATAHRTNAIRVQIGDRGYVVQFELNEGAVEKATWKGQTFIKDIQ